ncbi:MAG: hypothetical protein JKY37_05690 [Nannocystaceae bacterium]|nr:hypothetical protein [Nannocystaceae bacterium]
MPLVRLSEHGQWGGSLQQAGVPEFTLYADGLVIFARGQGDSAQPMQARLSTKEAEAVLERANATLSSFPERTNLVSGSDAAEAAIGVTYEGRIYSVSMYGFGSGGAKAPEAFTELHNELVAWDHPDAEPWTPDELTIVMFRVDGAPSNAWPKELPPPPNGSSEPPERAVGRDGASIRQPIRYRVPGNMEAVLGDIVPPLNATGIDVDSDERYAATFAWSGAAWHARYQRVVPERMWFWPRS